MNEQLNFFDIIGEAETPLIPFEEQKAGRRGWILEISAILLKKNGWKEDAVCVCTRPVVFEKDSEIDKYGRMWQMAKTTYGPASGWSGYRKDVYASRPTWSECVKFARKQYTIPQTVRYYERDGRDHSVWEYEKGYTGRGKGHGSGT